MSKPLPDGDADAYRFTRLSTSLFIQDLGFSKGDAQPGSIAPNATLQRLDGSAATLQDAMQGLPTLIVFGSISCPMTFGSVGVLHGLHQEFGTKIKFLMLNVREAHPGEHLEQPQTQPLKLAHARLLAAQAKGGWETLVDSIDGELHRALAEKPNAAFLLSAERKILFRSLWGGDQPALRAALTALVQGIPLKRFQSSAVLGPLGLGLGFFAPVLARSGKRARRELLLAAPPVAVIAALASTLRPLALQRRGAGALALVLMASVAAIGAGLWVLLVPA